MLAEDSYLYRKLGQVLEHKNCRVLRDASQVETIPIRQIDLILVQVNRGDGKELSILKQVKRVHPQVKVVLCSRDGETAFPLEAYQLEVDDYLFMPCRLAELWRRVTACLKRPPGKSSYLPPAPPGVHVSRTLREKSQRMVEPFRYNLGSSTSTLKTLINATESRPDEKFMAKIHEVSARLEVLQEMVEGFLQGLSRMEALACSLPKKDYGRLSLFAS